MSLSAFTRSDFLDRVHPTIGKWSAIWLVAAAAAVPLGTGPSNVIGGCLFFTLLAAGGYREHWARIRRHPFALATIILFAVIFLGVSYSNAPFDEIRRTLTKYARLLYAPIAIAVLVDGRWRRRALLAWMLSMLLTLLLSYLHSVWAFPLARATRERELDDHFIFKHHITQNVMMSVFAIAAFAQAWRLRAQRLAGANVAAQWTWLWIAVAFAAAVNVLFFVLGRTGYLTLLVNLVVVVLVAFVAAKDRRLMVVAASLMVIGIGAAVNSQTVHSRLQAAINEVESSQERGISTSMGQRMEYASKSIDLIKTRPILGWGTGSYAMEYCRIAKSPEWCKLGAYNPHNQFLFFAVQFGLLGLVALVAWIVLAGVAMQKLPLADRLLGFSLLATLCVHSMLDSPLYIVTEGTWYPLMLGILAAGAYHRNNGGAAPITLVTPGHSG